MVTTDAASSAYPSGARFVAGALSLLVAAGASAALVAEHFGGIGLPGCGAGGGCGEAARSVYGKLPLVGLPTSGLGLAYFLAALAGYVSVRGRVGRGCRWVARLGALASAGFLVVSIVEDLICPYCIVSHLANFAFVGVLESTRRQSARGTAGLWPAVAMFLLTMGALGIAEAGAQAKARDEAERALSESTNRLLSQSQGTTAIESSGIDPDSIPDDFEPVSEPEKDAAEPVSDARREGSDAAGANADDEGAIALGVMSERGAEGEAVEEVAAAEMGPGFTGRYRLGPEVSPVRIVIFSDYQCPECKNMEKQAMEVLEKHPEVSLSAKHFPFCNECNRHYEGNKHPNACRAARAAEAAGIVGGNDAFWTMHKWLFGVNGVFTPQELAAQAAKMGLDGEAFARAYADPATNELVAGDADEAMALGLRFTPTVYVNGVELRGTIATGALMRAVEALLATKPTPATAANDHPVGMEQKVAEDWLAETPMREGTDQRAWSLGPEDAPLKLSMWGDYQEPFTARADAALRELVTKRGDLRYTFRHYPVDNRCNMFVRQVMYPYSCNASRAAEAAGELGGEEGYWKMHTWLLANQATLTEQTIVAYAKEMGLDEAQFMQAYRGKGANDAIGEDTRAGARVNIQTLPTMMLNGRKVPRWMVGEEIVLDRILDAAAEDAKKAAEAATPEGAGKGD